MTRKAGSTPRFRKLFYLLVGLGVAALCVGIVWSRLPAEQPASSSCYRADVLPDSTPEKLIGGLILLRAEQLVSVPVVDGFQWPCGSPNGAMIYDAQGFGEMNARRGGRHTGQDLNGIGGGNTDLGLPVVASARGLVVYSGKPSPFWGNVVVLAHRLPDTREVVQTLYAHLDKRDVHVGSIVGRGERIGSIGTADGLYLAHLHFEAIASLCTEAGMPGYHPAGTMNRISPTELMQRYPAPDFPDMLRSVRMLRIREAAGQEPASDSSPALPPGAVPVSPHQFLTP